MKIKYALAQFAGCLQIIFLLAIVLLWDRMLVMDLPFELNPRKWNPYMYWIVLLLVLEVIILFIVIPFMKSSKVNAGKENPPKPTWKEKIIMLVSNSCSGNWVDILFVLSFIFYMAWLPDACSDFVRDGLSPFRLLVYITGLFVMIVFKPTIYKEPRGINTENRTLLVTALSNVMIGINGPTTDPIIWPFADYKNIKKVIVILTDQIHLIYKNLTLEYKEGVNKAYKDYMYGMIDLYCRYCVVDKENVLKLRQILTPKNKKTLDYGSNEAKKRLLEKYKIKESSITLRLLKKSTKDHLLRVEAEHLIRNLIKSCIQAHNIDCELIKLEINDAIVFTDPVNYDDFDECNETCYDKVNSVMRNKFSDENVIVNITAGTATVTSVLTLNAIKGERGMIYRKQNPSKEANCKMTLANPNVMMVQFNELVKEKVEHE